MHTCLYAIGATGVFLVIVNVTMQFLGVNDWEEYLAPFALGFATWLILSLIGGVMLWLLFGEFALRANRGRAAAAGRKRSLDNITFAIAIVVLLVYYGRAAAYLTSLGLPYEKITFPGTSHPAVEIRYKGGFRSNTPYVFVGDALHKKAVLWIPWPGEQANAAGGSLGGQGRVDMFYSEWKSYAVQWSTDGARFGVLDGPHYLGAYDLRTKIIIQYNWWNLRGSQGEQRSEKTQEQIDEEIKGFLQGDSGSGTQAERISSPTGNVEPAEMPCNGAAQRIASFSAHRHPFGRHPSLNVLA